MILPESEIRDYEIDGSGSLTDVDETPNNPVDEKPANGLKLDVFIQGKGIIHSDLAARQFLLDSKLHVKLSDFGFSSFSDGDVVGFENASQHLPRNTDGNTIQSDLLALGSSLHKVMFNSPSQRNVELQCM